MALEHEFYLIDDGVETNGSWMHRDKSDRVVDSVVIHDDIILYINHSLDWIPSSNPEARGKPIEQGINYYGTTIFDRQAAGSLIGVFSAWRDLFKNAPDAFGLSIYDKDNKIFIREEVIGQLEKVIAMAEQLAKRGLYIYHCGV